MCVHSDSRYKLLPSRPCCSLETEGKTFYSAADKPTLPSRSPWASWSSLSRHRLIPASWRAVRQLCPSPWRLWTKQLVVVTEAAAGRLNLWKRALSAKYIQTWNYISWKCKILGANGKLKLAALYKQLTCLLQKYSTSAVTAVIVLSAITLFDLHELCMKLADLQLGGHSQCYHQGASERTEQQRGKNTSFFVFCKTNLPILPWLMLAPSPLSSLLHLLTAAVAAWHGGRSFRGLISTLDSRSIVGLIMQVRKI